MGRIPKDTSPQPVTGRPSILVSYFNRGDGEICRTFRQREGSICFRSSVRFQEGAVVVVRSCGRGVSCACDTRNPPMNMLGIVNRCREISGGGGKAYEVSVRYLLPEC